MLMRDVPLASILLDDGNIVIGTARDREHTDHVVPKTRRLIEERGFAAVAVEADWPDAYSRALGARTAVRDGGDG